MSSDRAIWLIAGGPMQVPVARQTRERDFRHAPPDPRRDGSDREFAVFMEVALENTREQ